MKTHSGSRRLNAGAQIRLTYPSSRRGLTLVLRVKNPKERRLRLQHVHQLAHTNAYKCSDELPVSIYEVPKTLCALSTNSVALVCIQKVSNLNPSKSQNQGFEFPEPLEKSRKSRWEFNAEGFQHGTTVLLYLP